ncbi:hypothetical protein [Pseudodesulfovibrio senegalensis]|uniref:Uncharacterized protein n=1 Tax=Pseudodesulfovibrio senegalensis TaxID=1721087 RepID=A0A6N6N7M8_9BACT|nr:hypothetical protein [Pseudodesulfovibrio senegalensis]KAB1443077.1 hypothetical protein F8A88_02090 [Pseudodesulfovibrio senegalensis]
MTDDIKRGPGRPPTRNKPHEGTERAIRSGKLDGRTKAAKKIKQHTEDFRQDPIAHVTAELEDDVAVNKLLKDMLVGYIANNVDKLTPDEMGQLLQRLSVIQTCSVRAYNSLLDVVEEE